MPNRIIKESIRTSKSVNALSDFQFRVWTYLITYVDDYGRGSADPELLKGLVFTRRKGVTEQQISKALADLANSGMITLYEVDGESFLYFPNWNKHQRIRDCKPKFPAPPECPQNSQPAGTFSGSPQSAATCGELPPESESNPNPESQKDICTELFQASAPEFAVSLILNDKSLYGIEQSKAEHWQSLFPAVDIMQELRKMSAWCEANPSKRKTRRGIERFITNWLSTTQDKGGTPGFSKRKGSYDIDEVEALSHFDLPEEL